MGASDGRSRDGAGGNLQDGRGLSRTLLLDADALAYRASAACQRTIDWGDDVSSTTTDLPGAKRAARETIDRLASDLEADRLVVCLSDDFHCFRKDDIDPTYKANRAQVERPLHLYELKSWLQEQYPSDLRRRLEADDVMGILSTEPHPGEDRIIVSQDKDMLTIPGLLYRPHSEQPAVQEVSEAAADRWHLVQTLAGDAVDGYPGAPGVGYQRAEEALDTLTGFEPHEHAFTRGKRAGETETRWDRVQMDRPWDVVVSLFAKAGRTEAQALTQARLARILRDSDWNGRPILWAPEGR